MRNSAKKPPREMSADADPAGHFASHGQACRAHDTRKLAITASCQHLPYFGWVTPQTGQHSVVIRLTAKHLSNVSLASAKLTGWKFVWAENSESLECSVTVTIQIVRRCTLGSLVHHLQNCPGGQGMIALAFGQ